MYEKWECFKFKDINGRVDLIPGNLIYHSLRKFQVERINDFWADGKCSKVVCTGFSWDNNIPLGL